MTVGRGYGDLENDILGLFDLFQRKLLRQPADNDSNVTRGSSLKKKSSWWPSNQSTELKVIKIPHRGEKSNTVLAFSGTVPQLKKMRFFLLIKN